jgi:addiction module RelE/StbE family toxin
VRRRVWSERAARQLGEIHAFIARVNPTAADRVLARIIAATARLEEYPYSARAGEAVGTRELVIPRIPYIVVYSVADDAIEIHGVFHTARDPRSRGFHEG